MGDVVTSLSGGAIAEQIRSGERRAADVVDAFLSRIREHDGRVHSFLELFESSARAEAEAVDRLQRAGRTLLRDSPAYEAFLEDLDR